jgi:alanine racemase
LEINLSAVEHNTRTVLSQTGVALMAVVKANAYGFGAVEVARAELSAGASYLVVARGCEAMELRRAGITAPVLVFGMLTPAEVDVAIAAGVTFTLSGFEAAELYSARARALGRSAKVHLKIDTGMGRFGVFAGEALPLAQRAQELGGLELEGIYTHFSQVDSQPDDPFTPVQLARFQQALDALRSAGFSPTWVHTANSAGAMSCPPARFNMVRVGSALVGIRPFYYAPFPPELRRVLTWKAQLASCRTLPDGWYISYGQTYRTQGEEIIGVVPAGYGDGFRRVSNNEVLIEGQRVPVVGRVCTDMSMLRLPHAYPLGTEIVLLGQQGNESIQIEDLSDRWHTSQADVTSVITPRVPRVYLRD